MKKLVSLIVLVLSVTMLMAQGESKRVLFIGNSYTEVNNLPQLVQRVAESAGDVVEYQSNTPGGCTFQQHCNNLSMDLIRQGGWDVVVLQEHNNPEGEAMFYMTWGRKYGDQQNAPYFPVLGTYEGMDSMLYERYMYMARQYDASVCPVGRVWRYLRTNNPEIELYQSDESHPSLAGSYAAACAFYTLIFHRSPQYITYQPEIDAAQALTIREAVQSVVFDTLSFWLRQTTDTVHHDTTQVDTTQMDTTQVDTTQIDTTQVGIGRVSGHEAGFRVYPNPATDQVTVHFPLLAEACEVTLSDMKGRKLRAVTLSGSQNTLSLSDLPKGVYLLTVISPTNHFSTRILKQ